MVQFYGRMDLVISPSKYIHGMLVKAGLVAERGIVLSNGIEIDEYNKYGEKKKAEIERKHGLPVDRLLITYIGRLDPEKNIVTLLSLMKHFMNNRKVLFVIAGAGKLRPKLEAIARRKKCNFILLNWLSHEELLEILGVSDIFFNPSPSESQSITTLEAMASYLPIVAADRGALVDLVEEGVNGYIFKYNDLNGCVEKLTLLLKEEKLREDFGKKSRQKAHYHDRARVMKQLEREYNKLD
jgi:glycosyltransferase involved in cell wall biosynthesis